MLPAIRAANSALAFVLELGALVAYGYAAYSLVPGGVLRIVLALAIPLGVAVVWGVLVAPRAPVRLGRVPHLVLAVVVLGGAGVALALAGHQAFGVAFAVLAVVNRGLIEFLER